MSLLAGLLAGPSAALEVGQIVSPRGIKAWLVEEHSIPLVAIRFAFMGGAAQDPPGKEGLADMVSDLLTEGASDMNAKTFKKKDSENGTRLSVSSGRDAIYGGSKPVEVVRAVRRIALAGVGQSSFRCRSVERARAQHLTDLARAANDPTRLALDRWYVEAFPPPYGRSADERP
jgi:zinc protease